MTKPPKLATAEDLIAISAKEDMAKGTIGAAVIQLVRGGLVVSWPAIKAKLDEDAARSDMLAVGALRFIAALPSDKAD